MSEPPDESRLKRLPAEVTGGVAGGLAGLLVAGPVGVVLGAALAPTVTSSAVRLFQLIGERRARRATTVLASAAHYAGVDPDELLERLDSSPEREELLVQTIRVAQESALEGKLYVLGAALARGSTAYNGDVASETAFVRALGDCDLAHVTILEGFTRTANSLGLGDGSADFDKPSDGGLNTAQLPMAFPRLAPLCDHILATLQRHGLIAVRSGRGGMFSSSTTTWEITTFGRVFLDRIRLVAQIGGDPEPSR